MGVTEVERLEGIASMDASAGDGKPGQAVDLGKADFEAGEVEGFGGEDGKGGIEEGGDLFAGEDLGAGDEFAIADVGEPEGAAAGVADGEELAAGEGDDGGDAEQFRAPVATERPMAAEMAMRTPA